MEGLKDLISWRARSHHIGSLEKKKRGEGMLQICYIYSAEMPEDIALIKYSS